MDANESFIVTIQMNGIEQYFSLVLLILKALQGVSLVTFFSIVTNLGAITNG